MIEMARSEKFFSDPEWKLFWKNIAALSFSLYSYPVCGALGGALGGWYKPRGGRLPHQGEPGVVAAQPDPGQLPLPAPQARPGQQDSVQEKIVTPCLDPRRYSFCHLDTDPNPT